MCRAGGELSSRKHDLARWIVIVIMSQAALLLGALYLFMRCAK